MRRFLGVGKRSNGAESPDSNQTRGPSTPFFVSYDDWPPDWQLFVSHESFSTPQLMSRSDSESQQVEPEETSGALSSGRRRRDGPDPGFEFMCAGASQVYSREDVAALVAAASRSKGLVDQPSGSLRVMEAETGREAARHTRDPNTWTSTNVDGRLLILYGAYAVAAVRARLGEHAPEVNLPHLEAEKEEIAELEESEIPEHPFHVAWRIRWVQPETYGEGYFRLEETAIPQLWCASGPRPCPFLKMDNHPIALMCEGDAPTGHAARLACAHARLSPHACVMRMRTSSQVGGGAECHRAAKGRLAVLVLPRNLRHARPAP